MKSFIKYPIDNYTKDHLNKLKNLIHERRTTDPLFHILDNIIQRQRIVNRKYEHDLLIEKLNEKRIPALRLKRFDLTKL